MRLPVRCFDQLKERLFFLNTTCKYKLRYILFRCLLDLTHLTSISKNSILESPENY
jgi:hypothetical protein